MVNLYFGLFGIRIGLCHLHRASSDLHRAVPNVDILRPFRACGLAKSLLLFNYNFLCKFLDNLAEKLQCF